MLFTFVNNSQTWCYNLYLKKTYATIINITYFYRITGIILHRITGLYRTDIIQYRYGRTMNIETSKHIYVFF